MDGNGYQDTAEPVPVPEYSDADNETMVAAYEAYLDSRLIVQPEPEFFERPEERMRTEYEDHEPDFSLRAGPLNLRKEYRRLQIIVKLANIHLTPEKPGYEGGSWHVEGQLNEQM